MMIDTNIEITGNCDECEEKINLDEECIYLFHEDCFNKYAIKMMKDAMTDVITNNKAWEDYDHYVGFKNEEEKKCYMDGIREGMRHAFFWYADYYGNDGVLVFESLNVLFTKKQKD